MNVRAHDLFVQEAEVGLQLHSPDLKFNVTVRTESLDKILRESDFITLHLPGSGQAVVGAAEIAKMRPGVFLINTARGGVIDEEALLAGLESGQVGGAGLDVYENEPTPRGSAAPPESVVHPAHRRQHRGSAIVYRHGTGGQNPRVFWG